MAASQPLRNRHVAAILSSMTLLGGCSSGVLDPQGPIGAQEKVILINSLGIMLAIVLPTIVLTLGFAWWFRASNGRARYLPDWEYSGRLELIVWSIPAMVVLLLGGIAWVGSHDLDPPRPIAAATAPIEVQVVALDWKWLFIYPGQGIASVNRLVVPVGTPVRFRLTSASVMNSFFVPQLGSQIYAMAGMATTLYLRADHPGNYRGQSAQFSGDGFSDMHFSVDAVAPTQFAAWTSVARAAGPALDTDAYAKLAHQGLATPQTYRSVTPGLFDAVVAMRAPPGSAPAVGRPDVTVSPRTGK